MSDMPFKPSVSWLKRVEKCDVYSWFRYSARTGGKNGFRGGMVAYLKHLRAGFVNRAPVASLGRRGFVTLTDTGRAALSNSKGGEG